MAVRLTGSPADTELLLGVSRVSEACRREIVTGISAETPVVLATCTSKVTFGSAPHE
ncbi:hypothetical protein GCM10020360_31250 [Nonlabens tegetincola]